MPGSEGRARARRAREAAKSLKPRSVRSRHADSYGPPRAARARRVQAARRDQPSHNVFHLGQVRRLGQHGDLADLAKSADGGTTYYPTPEQVRTRTPWATTTRGRHHRGPQPHRVVVWATTGAITWATTAHIVKPQCRATAWATTGWRRGVARCVKRSPLRARPPGSSRSPTPRPRCA